jgi:predicted phosphate transport protein (TIGR00153 family)
MGKMSKKSVDYFEMFEHGISISLEAAQALQAAFGDEHIVESELKSIKEIEHKGDVHVHQCLRKIDVAFITPIDRTDIVEIIKAIENLTDSIDAVANHIYILNVQDSNTYLRKFVDYIVMSCKKLDELMEALKNFKKTHVKINECIVEVNRIEEEADRTYAESMRKLFERETDPIAIIKKKELYQLLEHTVDCCEDVADLVEKVMVAKT